jgi:UDP-N-acetylglucosamine 2-epimerase (non-hydrolysing)
MAKVLFIFGTRPEAIKLCPVFLHLKERQPGWSVKACVTAQHRSLLDQVLSVFGVEPAYDLNAMEPAQTLFRATAGILAALEGVMEAEKPDFVVVQGDTTTTLCGALAGFYARVPVGHVEAGLRTGDLERPFPEEANRVLVSRLASLHFAPTPGAATNLLKEGVDAASVTVTGNPGIDAVLYVRERLSDGRLHGSVEVDPSRRLILVTAHRRESFGEPFEQICTALAELAGRQDVQIVYPVHPNPNVRDPVYRLLRGYPNIRLLEPLDYVSFVALLERASIVLTDSGGIQEEAPSLGKPVLVMREKTERPEAVLAGTARLVGSRAEAIVAQCARLLDDPRAYAAMAQVHNPFGDGHASERIGERLTRFLAERGGA